MIRVDYATMAKIDRTLYEFLSSKDELKFILNRYKKEGSSMTMQDRVNMILKIVKSSDYTFELLKGYVNENKSELPTDTEITN